jgi:hypothetical protein
MIWPLFRLAAVVVAYQSSENVMKMMRCTELLFSSVHPTKSALFSGVEFDSESDDFVGLTQKRATKSFLTSKRSLHSDDDEVAIPSYASSVTWH